MSAAVTAEQDSPQAALDLDRSDWELVSFGDVAQKQNTSVDRENTELTQYVAGEHMGSEDLHLRDWGEISDNYLGPAFTRKFEKGDILYGSRRTYLRKVAVAHFDGITANTTFVIKPNEELILKKLLPFIMLSEGFAQHSIRNSKGSVNPYVNWKDIADYEFLLPPKHQQTKLAELLWAADKEVETLRASEAALTNLRDSTFKAFRQTLDKKHSKKVADLLLDGPRNGFSPRTSDDGTSYTVSIGAVSNGRFMPEGNLKRATVEASTLEKFDVRENDLFVVRGNGNRLLCGRAGIATASAENLFYPDLLIRLRFDEGQINPQFAAYQWNHPSAHFRLLQWAKSTNGIWKINGADIKNHSLIVPPLADQARILAEVATIEERLTRLKSVLSSSTALKKSLINQIF